VEYRCHDTKKGVQYFNCSRCGATAILYPDNQLYASAHKDECHPYPKSHATACQSELKAKEFVIMGVPPRKAHDLGFLDAVENEAEDDYKPYYRKRKVYARAYNKKLGLEECSIGNTGETFKTLISSTPNLRWLLNETEHYAVFASDRMLLALAFAEVLAVDATFSVRPDDTSQV
jgi:hypothetical protein